MTRDYIINQYFEWMYGLVYNKKISKRTSYRKLLYCLHNRDFDYILGLDGNRAEDGIELRYRFGNDFGYNQAIIASNLDDRPCSVLEMMVALAHRCEESIMDDPDIGDRTWEWFWSMIKNLNLYSMDDKNFDRDYVEDILTKFLNREYEPDGTGGLFTITSRNDDLRNVEIWYQMMWHLDEVIGVK